MIKQYCSNIERHICLILFKRVPEIGFTNVLLLTLTELLLLVGILLLILTCGFVIVHFVLREFNCFIQDVEHNANFNLSKYEVVMPD